LDRTIKDEPTTKDARTTNLSLKLAGLTCVLENGRISMVRNSSALTDNIHVKKASLGKCSNGLRQFVSLLIIRCFPPRRD